MPYCTNCGKFLEVETKFCSSCGTASNSSSGISAQSPAQQQTPNKFVTGGDFHSETNVYNQDETMQMKTCVVSGKNAVVTDGAVCRSCDGWAHADCFDLSLGICRNCMNKAQSEKIARYTEEVKNALSNDRLIDQNERMKLDSLAGNLGISPDKALEIEHSLKSSFSQNIAEGLLTPREKMLLGSARKALFENNDCSGAYATLEQLRQVTSEVTEIEELFLLAATEQNPEMGLSVMDSSSHFRHDSPKKIIIKIDLLEALGRTSEADIEERNALRSMGSDRLVQAKSLERLIDLYVQGSREESQLAMIKDESTRWVPPQVGEDPYLHFVEAYLRQVVDGVNPIELLAPGSVERWYYQRKNRLHSDSRTITAADLSFTSQTHVPPTRSSPMMSVFSSQVIASIEQGNGSPASGAGIIRSISQLVGIEIEDAAKIVDGFWSYIADGNNYCHNSRLSLVIPKFGSFFISRVSGRIGINPQTGERIQIKPQNRISFKSSPAVNLNEIRKKFWDGNGPPNVNVKKTSANWTNKWKGRGLRHLSKKRRIAVFVHELTGLPLYQVSLGLDTLYNLILAHIVRSPVRFFGRGQFRMQKRAARLAVNPQTGEQIKIKASNYIRFKAGTSLKKNLITTW